MCMISNFKHQCVDYLHAVTGFISAVVGELLTGRGALGQLQLETRLPQNVINWAVIGIVVSFVTDAH